MNIELKPIAVSKVRQLGGDVCGVLVRNDVGARAAVDEHGRVQWLQSGQGAEAKGFDFDGWHDKHESLFREGAGKADLRAAYKQGYRDSRLQPAQHPDDAAVDRFAEAMKAKLAKKRAEGRGGWEDPQVCPSGRLQQMLLDHLTKGDPVDIGNFAMMIWNRGEAVAGQPAQQGSAPEGWKLVPIEPTRDMRRAFHDAHERFEVGEEVDGSPDDEWRAMLSASPQPPKEGE